MKKDQKDYLESIGFIENEEKNITGKDENGNYTIRVFECSYLPIVFSFKIYQIDEDDISRLEREKKILIEKEDYEGAAKIRDQIEQIKSGKFIEKENKRKDLKEKIIKLIEDGDYDGSISFLNELKKI